MTRILVLGVALALSARAHAQVGHPLGRSPYRDLPYRQEFSISSGYLSSSGGAARVGPRDGPLVSARYELRLGGPVMFNVGLGRAFTERTVVSLSDSLPRASETQPWPLLMIDFGLEFSLTGRKSYHHVVPVVALGAGVVSDMGKGIDAGGFKFGSPFALSMDAGVRWIASRKLQLRADMTNRFFQVGYPNAYFVPPDGGAPLVDIHSPQRDWTRTAGFTVGLAYLFVR
jgi:hypothetical protein